ncbi:hypothetical protein HMPREF9151_01649 [Hoylesella saccharolytica F0055]|uniref:Uncharacterized protein n=1 Tax=Hoylesella saccharolytica F0055 TaxID=1127699 RepID=L1N8A2_9BACT|nr:hypothetical protein HMPREF9151_01649 [Hoylesella saccharolytica F0055]
MRSISLLRTLLLFSLHSELVNFKDLYLHFDKLTYTLLLPPYKIFSYIRRIPLWLNYTPPHYLPAKNHY